DLEQTIHVDVGPTGERPSERIHLRPGPVFEDPPAGHDVEAEIARDFRPPGQEHGQGSHGEENRLANPRVIPRLLRRTPLRRRAHLALPALAALIATSGSTALGRPGQGEPIPTP